ncbi:MAG: 50S ribosomal protein L28 [Planctomycetes bacterium]|nr:50S ribosomal protein L28 [Planctomycetota bacterium]
MSRRCEYCGKKTEIGYQITRRGLAKAKGGVGRKVTGRTKRKFHPNLQQVRAVVDGTVRRVNICTRCIKSGKLKKPLRRDRFVVSASPAKSSAEAS